MLVLQRKKGEIVDLYFKGVKIAEVKVLDQNGRDTHLGFAAGPEVFFLRRELAENGKFDGRAAR